APAEPEPRVGTDLAPRKLVRRRPAGKPAVQSIGNDAYDRGENKHGGENEPPRTRAGGASYRVTTDHHGRSPDQPSEASHPSAGPATQKGDRDAGRREPAKWPARRARGEEESGLIEVLRQAVWMNEEGAPAHHAVQNDEAATELLWIAERRHQ